jgi:hypothetical protein
MLKVGSGCGVLSEVEPDKSQMPVAQRHKQRVIGLLSQTERLLRELTRPVIVSSHKVQHRQLTQYLAQLMRLPQLLA